jgi:peptidoglycan/LPS O-acetylase OafA/YrhL
VLQYRREIDGLRALAILPVVAYHANSNWISGGYAGVDVFFVVSGYLIASIIFAEKRLNTFTLRGFYERRARRILPALFFVAFACIPLAVMWMTKAQLEEFFESLAAVAVFASNFLFWDQTGYFGVAAETKPLLHTWSLAVEEQFYLFFPLLVLALWKLPRRALGLVLLALCIASLAFSHYLSQVEPSANFYWSPTRVWELLLGVLLALTEHSRSQQKRINGFWTEALALAGLLAIVASFFIFDRNTPFPGLPALVPTLGTVLVLAFARDNTLTGRLLALAPLVGIGLISYSVYLWHQPLFAFARLRSLGELETPILLALIAAALMLGYLSWRFIERPFRDRRQFSRKTIFAAAAFAGVVAVAGGVTGSLSSLTDPARRYDFSPAELAAIAPANGNDALENCDWESPVEGFPRIKSCRFGAPDAGADLVLFGDSHAEALFSAVGNKLEQQRLGGVLVQNRYCDAVVGIYEWKKARPKHHGDCARAHEALLAYIQGLGPEGVIFAMRWSFKLYPIEGEIDELEFDNGEGGVGGENHRTYYAFSEGKASKDGAAKIDAVRQFLGSLLDLQLPLFLVYPVPEVGWRISDYNFKHLLAGRPVPQSISVDYELFAERNRFVIDQLDKIDNANLVRIKPAELLCNTYVAGRCAAQADGKPLYNDDDHLSDLGAELVAARIVGEFRQRQAR